MTTWTAIVPVKPKLERKTRLAAAIDEKDRLALTDRMLAHVVDTLASAAAIARTMILAAEPPPGWRGAWLKDRAQGLNAELQDACGRLAERVLVIHADLPLLSTIDVALLAAAADTTGIALAPDRHGVGTNAIALRRVGSFRFAFGPESFRRHVAVAGSDGAIVRRPGLAFDIDTPADLAALRAVQAAG